MWRTCERWGLLPPNIKSNYEENDPWAIAQLIGYEQVRQLEEASPETKPPKSKGKK